MIRINLLPSEEAERAAGKRQDLAAAALVVAVAVLLFVVAHGWQHARMASAERELARINTQLAAIQGPYADVTRMEQQKKELKEKLAVIAELEAKKVGPVRMLSDLSTATPDKLWLMEFTEAGGKVKISGLGVDEQTVADFLRRLGSSPYFREIDLDEASLLDKDGAKHKKFVISGQVNYLGTQPPAHVSATAPSTSPSARPATAVRRVKP